MNSHNGNHWNTRLATLNHRYHPVQDTSSKQQTKQKYKPNHKQTGLPPSFSLANQRKNKQKQNQLSTNLTLFKAYTNHWTNLRREETRRKKEFNLEGGKGDLKHNKLKQNNERADKYYTNEGTN